MIINWLVNDSVDARREKEGERRGARTHDEAAW